MSGLGPRGDDDFESEQERELTPAAYAATVPNRLTGFRGTNPALLVLAGALALAILVVSAVSFFHHGSAANAAPLAAEDVQPAAPGVGGEIAATPFVPGPAAATPYPSYRRASEGVPYLPERPQPPAARPAYPQTHAAPAQVPFVPQAAALERATVPDDDGRSGGKMQLEQPQQASGTAATSSQDAQASRDLSEHFVPVYRNGKIVAVVPVESNGGPSTPPVEGSVNGEAAESSAQFVSSSSATNGTGSDGAPAREKRRFSAAEQARDVGHVARESATQIDTSTVINARLLTKIESDLPGPVIAQVTQPVYDSATHSVLVIPAGTKVFGIYDNSVVQNQTRLLMAFRRLIFPNGREFDLGGLPGADALGTSGFSGDVDKHRGEFYTSALLLTVLGGVEAAITPSQNTLIGGQTIASQVQSSAGAQLSNLGDKILNNAYLRTPTIIIRPPYGFNIIVTRDLALDEYVP